MIQAPINSASPSMVRCFRMSAPSQAETGWCRMRLSWRGFANVKSKAPLASINWLAVLWLSNQWAAERFCPVTKREADMTELFSMRSLIL